MISYVLILAGNDDRHKILDEVDIGPDRSAGF